MSNSVSYVVVINTLVSESNPFLEDLINFEADAPGNAETNPRPLGWVSPFPRVPIKGDDPIKLPVKKGSKLSGKVKKSHQVATLDVISEEPWAFDQQSSSGSHQSPMDFPKKSASPIWTLQNTTRILKNWWIFLFNPTGMLSSLYSNFLIRSPSNDLSMNFLFKMFFLFFFFQIAISNF